MEFPVRSGLLAINPEKFHGRSKDDVKTMTLQYWKLNLSRRQGDSAMQNSPRGRIMRATPTSHQAPGRLKQER